MFSRSTRWTLAVVAMMIVATGCTKGKEDDMGSASATPATSMAMDAAEYTLVWKSNWSPANHPVEFPTGSAHFSGVIGAAHDSSYSLFKQGSMPTAGLEMLSEMGKPV